MKTLEKIVPERRTKNVVETTYEITTEMDVRDDQLRSETTLTYDLSLRYIGGGVFTNWEKSNFRINGKKSFIKIDEIYLKVSRPVNKLHFYYNKGKISEIKNHKDILEEWKEAKEQVINEFYGEVLNTIVDITEKNYNDEERLCELLSRDLALQHLYNSTDLSDELIYADSSKKKRTFLGVLDEVPLTYYEVQKLSTIGDQLRIKTRGKQRIQNDISVDLQNYFKSKIDGFKEENFFSTLIGDYIIDPKTLWINEAVIVHDTYVRGSNYGKKITLTIKRK